MQNFSAVNSSKFFHSLVSSGKLPPLFILIYTFLIYLFLLKTNISSLYHRSIIFLNTLNVLKCNYSEKLKFHFFINMHCISFFTQFKLSSFQNIHQDKIYIPSLYYIIINHAIDTSKQHYVDPYKRHECKFKSLRTLVTF